MKKANKLVMAGVIAAVLSIGAAGAAPAKHGGHSAPAQHTVVHVQTESHHGGHHQPHGAPHHGHHNPRPHHHAHYYRSTTGDWILATAILISALI